MIKTIACIHFKNSCLVFCSKMSHLETPGHIVAASFGYAAFLVAIIVIALLSIAMLLRYLYRKQHDNSTERE